jgi:hypothetical protein
LVGKSEGKRLLEISMHIWKDKIRIDFREIGWECVDWMHPARDSDQRRALVTTIMNFRVP